MIKLGFASDLSFQRRKSQVYPIVSELPLINYLNLSILINDVMRPVKELVREDGHWDRDYLKNIFDPNVCLKIFYEVAPTNNSGRDQIIWKHQSNGAYSIKSAYSCKNKVYPIDLRVFIWLIAHNRILTRQLCSNWFGGHAWCHECPAIVENFVHVLMDYLVAIAMWSSLVAPNHLANFYQLDFDQGLG